MTTRAFLRDSACGLMPGRGMMTGTDGAEDEGGVEGCHYGLPSFVFPAAWQAAAVTCRLYRVTGEHAIPDWGAAVQGHPGQPGGHRVADVFEVWRAAPDDHAEAG